MKFPERFSDLPEYAFPRLRSLLESHPAGGPLLSMSIGEPRHGIPAFVSDVIAATVDDFGKYPPNDGSPALLDAIAAWISRRYGVQVDPATQLLALNGSREGLFNACLAACPETKDGRPPIVLVPNPFYQVYGVGALAAGAEPFFVPATADNGFLPDYAGLPADILDRTAIAYVCSPSNPQGAIAPAAYLAELLALGEKHDFKVFADECYSEIYRDEPPTSALQAADRGTADPERLVIFQSLSKRSNLPGLRSGFAVGGQTTIAAMKRLRAYAGAPVPLPLQHVAERAWSDEAHVVASRALYREKFELADQILGDVPGYTPVSAGLFLWLDVGDGEAAAVKLWTSHGVRVLPGRYLGRDTDGPDVANRYIRVALVAPKTDVARGLNAIRGCLF